MLHYDALGRLIRSDTPKGFFSRVVFSPWAVVTYDETDTVLESPFYRGFPANPTTPAEQDERDALDKAAISANTPTVTLMDPLGRPVRNLENNLGAVTTQTFAEIVAGTGATAQQLWDHLVADGYLARDAGNPQLAWPTAKLQPYDGATQQAFTTRYGNLASPVLVLLKTGGLTGLQVLDAAGRPLRSIDPRLLYANVTTGSDLFNLSQLYDMAGQVLLRQSCDAGSAWTLTDIFGRVTDAWDSRGFHVMHQYDRLGRPLCVQVIGGDGSDGVSKFASAITAQLLVYGEGQPEAVKRNLLGRLYQHYDPAGLLTIEQYDLAGAVAVSSRRLRTDYAKEADWTAQAITAVAAAEAFETRLSYDALGRITQEAMPNGSVVTRRYDIAGRLTGVDTSLAGEPNGATVNQTVVESIAYDAKGQRTRLVYGNGVTTTLGYEDTTLRLVNVNSTRAAASAGAGTVLQGIACTFDPTGNLTRKRDQSWQTVFCYNQQVDPLSDYSYDGLNRLVRASGRQQPGLQAPPADAMSGDVVPFCPPDPADQRKLEAYIQAYSYDDAGNLTTIRHTASASWTRTITVAAESNRCTDATYDGNGNTAALDHLRGLTWSYRDSLARADVIVRQGGDNDSEFYLYDAAGNRVLKVSERVKGPSLTEVEETIYLGSYEVKRISQRSTKGKSLILERQTLGVGDGKARACLIEFWTKDDLKREVDAPNQRRFRYQLDDYLGSVALELDETGQRITYEEFLPYGGSALIAAGSAVEVSRKRYGYSGKERDGMTGLIYYGARYYPPWMGRWINPDPAGAAGGLNLYQFVGGNPTSRVEVDGRVWDVLAGAAATLLTGGAVARFLGFARGTVSGTIAGATAGAVGAVVTAAVGGTLTAAALPAIGTAAAVGAVASLAGAVIGGALGTDAMDENRGARTNAATGTLASAVGGAAIGIGVAMATGNLASVDTSAVSSAVTAVAAAGAATVSSGSYLGFIRTEGMTVNPVELTDTTRIVNPEPRDDQGRPIHVPNKLLIVMASHQAALTRRNQVADLHNDAGVRTGDATGAFRLKPNAPASGANENLNTVAVHGMRGYVMVATAGDVLRPMSIENFADYVHTELHTPQHGLDYTGSIKLISCFGGAVSLGSSNAQVLADRTRRTVYAFPFDEAPSFGHVASERWKTYTPRAP